MGKALAIFGFVMGAGTVLLQSWLTVTSRLALGDNIAQALIFFLSFFTILTNIAAVAVYAADLFPGRLGPINRMGHPIARATVAAWIAVVGLVYATVLAGIWQLEGLFWLCDILLHYVAPVTFLIWWTGFGHDGSLNWSDTPKFIVLPIIYLGYLILRGKLTGAYPYPFVNVDTLGGIQVAINCVLVAALFMAFSLAAIAFDRSFKSRSS